MEKIIKFFEQLLPLVTFYPKWAQVIFLLSFILVLISVLLFVVLYPSASARKVAAPSGQSQTVSVSSHGDRSPAFGIVHGNVIIQNSPTIPLEWKEAFDGLPPSQNTQDPEPFATRTFSILREKGATFTLGPCPSNQCMIFELGDFREEKGVLLQEIFLHGSGFGVKRRPESKYLLQMDRPMKLRGASLSIPLGGGKMTVLFQLHRDSSFDMFTSIADIRITTSDLSADRLKLKLEIRPPSGFRLAP
jgi:hypothetical protein